MRKIDIVKLFGVGIAIISVFIIAMLNTPIAESQQTCSSGTYTLNGNLKVNGDIQANNFQSSTASSQQAQPASFGSCVIVDGSYGSGQRVSCPTGKILVGATCNAESRLRTWAACGHLVYHKGADVLSSPPNPSTTPIQGADGVSCFCTYENPSTGGSYIGPAHISLFCC